MAASRHYVPARAAIEADGLLMLQDPALPSLVRMVAGEPVKGSWWAHPSGGEIFAIASALDDDPDVATMKLVAGKVTFVHRRLWPAVVAIGRSNARWQIEGLGRPARALLERLEQTGELAATGEDAKLVVARLLAHGAQRHTDAGHHANVLQSWTRFAQLHAIGDELPTPTAAREQIERVVKAWALDEAKRAKLPWAAKR